jgi:hypothetical protein
MLDFKPLRKLTQSELLNINNNMISFMKNTRNYKTIMNKNLCKFKKFKEKTKKSISMKFNN